MRRARFRSRSRLKRIFGDLLCFLGIHKDGEVGRYRSGDAPEEIVITCWRCGREKESNG